MTSLSVNELWLEWLLADAEGRPVTSKARATALLERLCKGDEPDWGPQARDRFLAWCDQEGLLIRGS